MVCCTCNCGWRLVGTAAPHGAHAGRLLVLGTSIGLSHHALDQRGRAAVDVPWPCQRVAVPIRMWVSRFCAYTVCCLGPPAFVGAQALVGYGTTIKRPALCALMCVCARVCAKRHYYPALFCVCVACISCRAGMPESCVGCVPYGSRLPCRLQSCCSGGPVCVRWGDNQCPTYHLGGTRGLHTCVHA